MEMAIGGEAAAAWKARGPTVSGEYWSEALKSFLDHIPVSSVPGAVHSSSSPALELNLDGCVLDAIGSMYRSNAGGAVIVDEVHSSLGKFLDRDIGFVDFPSLVLLAPEGYDSGEWVIDFKPRTGSKEEIKEKDARRRWKAFQQHKIIEKWVDHRRSVN